VRVGVCRGRAQGRDRAPFGDSSSPLLSAYDLLYPLFDFFPLLATHSSAYSCSVTLLSCRSMLDFSLVFRFGVFVFFPFSPPCSRAYHLSVRLGVCVCVLFCVCVLVCVCVRVCE
jgi:hypothetical protein